MSPIKYILANISQKLFFVISNKWLIKLLPVKRTLAKISQKLFFVIFVKWLILAKNKF